MNERELLASAENIKREIICTYPEHTVARRISFEVSSRMTRTAGIARAGQCLVTISLPFFADESNFTLRFRNTILHEIAHIIARHETYPARIMPHGREWKAIARKIGCDAERCHTMDLAEGYAKRERKATVQLPCSKCQRPMDVGPTRYKRAMQFFRAYGTYGYSHKDCGRFVIS